MNLKSVRWLIAASSMASLIAAGVATLVPAYAQTAVAQTAARVSAVSPPAVPLTLRVPAGNRLFFVGHAVGTQNYVCLPSDTGVKFVLFSPQATLAGDNGQQVATHYFSPNPLDGTIRPTWELSNDTSTVWGQVIGTSSDSNFVAPGAIAWVLIEPVALQGGTAGGEGLTATTFVQRVNTTGGAAPSSGFALDEDVGHQAFVPYTADYFFYQKAN
jgi:hypothetical protein